VLDVTGVGEAVPGATAQRERQRGEQPRGQFSFPPARHGATVVEMSWFITGFARPVDAI